MKKESLVQAFCQLGLVMRNIGENKPWESFDIGITASEYDEFNALMGTLKHHNGWFTEEMIRKAIGNLGESLNKENLEQWCDQYTFSKKPKTIAVIMAGNIPLVGFHDFLCVLLSGNRIMAKMSSEDDKLLPVLAEFLICFYPEVKDFISFSDRNMKGFDAVIATGSDNTARYFEYYFKDKPSIIRKNRNSLAILTGDETKEDLLNLSNDIFQYYGLGCRSVSKLFVPNNYNFDAFFEAMYHWNPIINGAKYANNYDYNKAVYLMSEFKMLENGFLMLKEDTSYASPIATLFYENYESLESLTKKLNQDASKIQCIVSNQLSDNHLAFGSTQTPQLEDYADGVDTVDFLLKI